MSEYEQEDKELEIAQDWREAEGCEPGELLESLIRCAERSRDGYGYAASENNKMHDKLMECVREQYQGIRQGYLMEPDPYCWNGDPSEIIKKEEAL